MTEWMSDHRFKFKEMYLYE